MTVNYRLGVLGFFSLETPETPGNAGLYDLVVALQWVQNYIGYFGGDKYSVTLAGKQVANGNLNYDLIRKSI